LGCLSAFKRSTKKEQNLENKDIAMTWPCSDYDKHQTKDMSLISLLYGKGYKTLADNTSTLIPQSYLRRRGTFKDKLQLELSDVYDF
jgi:hypothetical protein